MSYLSVCNLQEVVNNNVNYQPIKTEHKELSLFFQDVYAEEALYKARRDWIKTERLEYNIALWST